jgi:hypothetical protein
VAGKRFCKQCGQAVAEAAPVETVFARHDLAAPPEPEVARKTEVVAQADSIPEWELVEQAAPALPSAPPAPASLPVTSGQSNRKIGVAIAIAAVVLLVVGGARAWHVYAHRGGASPVGAQQTTANLPAQNANPGAGAALGQETKPSAGTPAPKVPSTPQMPNNPAPPPELQPRAPVQDSDQSRHGDPAAPTPVFHPAPTPFPAQPAPNHSGVLHYQGPPVPYGGTVVFDNLPKARLRFFFDSAAWRLTIKLNPDGTKRVTLVSLKQGSQPNCELGWEIVE